MDLFSQRCQHLARALPDDGLDLFVVSYPVNVSYLTNFSGESSWLLVSHDRALLVSDGRFTEQIAEECPGLEAHIRPPGTTLQAAVGEVIAALGARAVGFESTHLVVSDLEALREAAPAVEWRGVRDSVEKLRAVKESVEIDQIREAIGIAERAFLEFRAMLRQEHSEKDLSDAMEMYVRRAGGRCTSFPTIVGVGPRAALPHCPPSRQCVGQTPLLLVDWGASGRFYKSDLTRVLVPRRTSRFSSVGDAEGADPRLQQIYDVVLRAQQAAIGVIRPGVKGGEVDAAARAVIAGAGFGDYFTHSIGHGLGMEVHELPMMRPGSEMVLQAGMVVTVEPGIYLPQWGGVRIEDDVLITPDGCEVLTHLPRDLPAMFVDC